MERRAGFATVEEHRLAPDDPQDACGTRRRDPAGRHGGVGRALNLFVILVLRGATRKGEEDI
jgi:hypothetical protein